MDNKKDNKDNKDKKGFRLGSLIMILILAALVTYMGVTFFKSCYNKYTSTEISYSKFIEMIEKNEIKSVKYGSSKIVVTPKEQPVKGVTLTYYTGKS